MQMVKIVDEDALKDFNLEIEYLDFFWHLKGRLSSMIFQEPRNTNQQTDWRLLPTFLLTGARSL